MADIPGIIEGAHQGKGLGLRFLKHIERNAMLLFLVPADSKDHRKEYLILLDELEKYNPELLDKDRFLVISKSDFLDEDLKKEISKELHDIPHDFISSVTGMGIHPLKDKIWKILNPS
jgi:GTP-binding protein